MFLNQLSFPVTDIEGIGPAAARSLSGLGIVNIGQLLRHYPLRYEDRITPVTLAQSTAETPALTEAKVVAHEQVHWKKGIALKVIIDDGTETAAMLCYGRNFLASKLPPGKTIRIAGPFVRSRFGEIQSSSFVFEDVQNNRVSREFGVILPVYPLSGNLTQGLLRKAIKNAAARYAFGIRDELPPEVRAEQAIAKKSECIQHVHFPPSIQAAHLARKALIFEELFHLQIALTRRRMAVQNTALTAAEKDASPSWSDELPGKLLRTLPFELTADQHKAIKDIKENIMQPAAMLRLIQGEVGSGKTLVAFIACLGVIGAGHQAAFMAPTELLARQHADNAARLLEPIGIRLAFLSGDVSGPSRRAVTDALAAGQIDMIVGTHALFSGDVVFADLSLAVIDEQHRFGVEQRRALSEKGQYPDILALSATPIPRTLALTAFGDMDVSTISTMPKGRHPVETHLARIGSETKVYDFVHRELSAGNRAYFVYPLIAESEKIALKDAENMFHTLKTRIFPNYRGALIHSRVDEEEKRRIMSAFRDGGLDYLVATSVIEVGVDVPEATCMVVEHAERFGLSALHQLRGRVGRGEKQSYCFLVYGEPLTDDGKKRLLTMKNTSDGFALAEEDLKLRGPGDMAGIRQSGFMKFSIADPVRDLTLLLEARDKARRILESDPGLIEERHKDLRELFALCPPFDENLLRTL
ncbi:MAG: hypothetical protein B0D92_04405 [Spirochaeta sp. LUC14_002_19_P3]|nr:MAG: hypothetical protein B0D92_04405 [Spirochaeta sp. LUC14_002_19_P3]